MSTSHPRRRATDLARAPLVLSAARSGRGWLLWCALVVIALVGGAAATHYYWLERSAQLQQQAVAGKELPQLQQALDQARLQLRVSIARSTELERQIDALNQQLREVQEELSFFRKARDGKR